MKTSLKDASKNITNTATPPEGVDQAALADITDDESGGDLPVVASSMSLALGKVSGAIDSHDLIIPRLHITQNVGPLSEKFDGGDLIFNKETVLVHKEEPVSLTVLSISKTFEEKILPYDPNGPRPRIFNTESEVLEAGLYTDWRNNLPPPVQPVASVLVFVEQPEGVEALGFNHSYGGHDYALVVWSLRGTGYTRAAKKIFSAAQIELAKDGLMSGKWSLSTLRDQINGNWIFAPVLRLETQKNTPEFVAFITERLS